ncbi:hypothetical protein K439DRAFT_1626064 [Ramaria rubella]|nr:hypothetical protein K439DRAFT_1626064 [Ramaria rubella]
MSFKQNIVNSLDELASSRSSPTRCSKALDALELVLARICVPSGASETELDAFLKLQDGFDCNVASRLMYSLSTSLPILQQTAHSTNLDNDADPDPMSISHNVIQSLSIIQGVALLHPPSKIFLSKKWCIQVLVDLLAISRHLCPPPLSSSTNTNCSPSSNRVPTLASSTLDTLLCVLVDAPAALRAFEEADGVEVVVKTLKRTGVPRDIRIKCLEFLYFYLLDETGDLSLTSPTKPKPPTPNQNIASASASSSRSASPDSTSIPRTPRKQPRNLALLRRDLDFIPITPKKAQVSRLGVGTPRTGTGAGAGRIPHSEKPGRSSPVDISITPASPTKRRSPGLSAATAAESQCNLRRSTQEKKEILSNLLGNVDALVEGVSKSGIWGLG